MAYVPSVPGFAPVSFGQGYGDWQQYAGYNKDKPFGVSPGFLPGASPQKVPSVAPIGIPPIEQQKPADYSFGSQPALGGSPKNQLGNFSQNQFGQPSSLNDILKNDETNFD